MVCCCRVSCVGLRPGPWPSGSLTKWPLAWTSSTPSLLRCSTWTWSPATCCWILAWTSRRVPGSWAKARRLATLSGTSSSCNYSSNVATPLSSHTADGLRTGQDLPKRESDVQGGPLGGRRDHQLHASRGLQDGLQAHLLLGHVQVQLTGTCLAWTKTHTQTHT